MSRSGISSLKVKNFEGVLIPVPGYEHAITSTEHHIEVMGVTGGEEQLVGTMRARLVEHEGDCTVIMHSLEMSDEWLAKDFDLDAIDAVIGMFEDMHRIDSAFFLMSDDQNLSMDQLNSMSHRYAPLGLSPMEIGSNMLVVGLDYEEKDEETSNG